MDVTAMQYPHFTQALTNEQAARQLYTVRTLREDYGLTVEAGVQSDITGNPWRFADILPAAGISFLTMAINMHRALAPEPRPGGFWWEGPAGGPAPGVERALLRLGPLARPHRRLALRRPLPAPAARTARGERLRARLPLRGAHPPHARRQRAAGSPHARLRARLERAGPHAADRDDHGQRVRAHAARAARRRPARPCAATGPTGGRTATGPTRAWSASTAGCGTSSRPARTWRRGSPPPARAAGTAGARSTSPTRCSSPRTSSGVRSRRTTPPTPSTRARSTPTRRTTSTRRRWSATTCSRGPPTAWPTPLSERGPDGVFNLGDIDPLEAYPPSGADSAARLQHPPVGARGHRRGAGAARQHRPGRASSRCSSRATCRGAASARSGRCAARPEPCRGWATPSSRWRTSRLTTTCASRRG